MAEEISNLKDDKSVCKCNDSSEDETNGAGVDCGLSSGGATVVLGTPKYFFLKKILHPKKKKKKSFYIPISQHPQYY
jgi:hypothetical protein